MHTTKKGIGAQIVEAMREALAIERGTAKPAKVHRVPLTARQATVEEAPTFDRQRVMRVREKLALSQAIFAQALNVKPATVRSWEQGQRVPDGAAARLLQIAEEHPKYLASKVVARPKDRRASADVKLGRHASQSTRKLAHAGKSQGRITK